MEKKMINLTIDNIPVSVPQGTTILEAARAAGIKIPSLCFLKEINEIGACRICVVEVKGARSLVASCVYPVNEGMVVYTNTERVRHSRRLTMERALEILSEYYAVGTLAVERGYLSDAGYDAMLEDMWHECAAFDAKWAHHFRKRSLLRFICMPGKFGRWFSGVVYRIANKVVRFC